MSAVAPEMTDSGAGEKARKRMQLKSFTTWVNLHLKKVGMEVSELKTDFADGVKLLKLIETISEESLGKYSKNPISKFQKVENLNLPLKYINTFNKQQGIPNQYSAENILEENEVLILGMVWTLILRFSVQEISEGDRTAKEGLLLWAQKKIEEASKGKVTVTNFHTTWQDGTAFCSLIQAFRPDLIDYASVRKSDDKATMEKFLNMAFDTAHEHLGIPKMLDAHDMACHRPDEKSVMTYVTFFWKEFASTKKKHNAAERISKVVQREIHYEELQAQYVAQATALADWLRETHAKFAAGPPTDLGLDELQQTLDEYVEYGRMVRPAKIQENMEVEALYASVSSRLAALGGRRYDAPEAFALPALTRAWEELTVAEQVYEEGIKVKLTSVKRIGATVKIFTSKAKQLDTWLAQKAAWVQAAHDPCLEKLGKPPAQLEEIIAAASEPTTPVTKASKDPANPPLEGVREAANSVDEKLDDPTLKPLDLDLSSPVSAGRQRATTSIPLSLETPKLDRTISTDDADKASKRPSFFGDLLAVIQDNFQPGEERISEVAESQETLSVATGSAPLKLKTKTSTIIFAEELAEQKVRQKESTLDSISAVLAKLNLLKAYEEEQASRKLTLDKLVELVKQLKEAHCPQIEDFEKRIEDLSNALTSLAAAAAAYHTDLELVLKQYQELDERRLGFAKRAEVLNRWIEETTDAMNDVLAIETMKEADAVEAELGTFRSEYVSQKTEGEALSAIGVELASSGPNPYSRFMAKDLEEGLQSALTAAEERGKRLEVERAKISGIDGKKKEFAEAADEVLAYLKLEKTALESATPPMSIQTDDADSIAAGKKAIAWLEEYLAKASERADQLSKARELADDLFQSGEMDNPYTRQSITSLKAAVDQLEKMVRDKRSLIQGQLDRATVQLSPAQHAELLEAFNHFDKTGDGKLNKLEFSAAVKSMDFEGDLEEEFGKYVDSQGDNSETNTPEDTISFEAFLNLMLAQFKDKDTVDGLVGAFRTLANGKDALPAEELEKFVKPADAEYLKGHFAEIEGGYDYTTFSKAIYGAGEAS